MADVNTIQHEPFIMWQWLTFWEPPCKWYIHCTC